MCRRRLKEAPADAIDLAAFAVLSLWDDISSIAVS